jgi:hypothetical protein
MCLPRFTDTEAGAANNLYNFMGQRWAGPGSSAPE